MVMRSSPALTGLKLLKEAAQQPASPPERKSCHLDAGVLRESVGEELAHHRKLRRGVLLTLPPSPPAAVGLIGRKPSPSPRSLRDRRKSLAHSGEPLSGLIQSPIWLRFCPA